MTIWVLKFDFKQLIQSEKFTPLIYEEANGEFFGESISFFSPVTKFTLNMKVTKDKMYSSEVFENNGKRILGFDEPIIYNKIVEYSNWYNRLKPWSRKDMQIKLN